MLLAIALLNSISIKFESQEICLSKKFVVESLLKNSLSKKFKKKFVVKNPKKYKSEIVDQKDHYLEYISPKTLATNILSRSYINSFIFILRI